MVGFGVSFGGSDEGAEGVVEPVGVVEPPVAGTVEVAEGVAEDEPVPVIVVVGRRGCPGLDDSQLGALRQRW